jgi:hypothetical protein
MKYGNEDWYCPVCKSEIIEGDYKKMQTLDEHVCNPNAEPSLKPTFKCSNFDCLTHKHRIFWDWFGALYGRTYNCKSIFINQNDAPFGSSNRKSNVEIYKAGLKDRIWLSPWWTLKLWQPMIEYKYTSNYDGDVLSKKIKIKFLKKSRGSKTYSTYVSFWWSTIKYLWKKRKLDLKTKNYKKLFEKSFNRSFKYRLMEQIIKLRHWKIYLKYIKNI